MSCWQSSLFTTARRRCSFGSHVCFVLSIMVEYRLLKGNAIVREMIVADRPW
jgi:hypothetical protein